MPRGDEQRVVEAFCAWLRQGGWTVETEIAFVDILAQRAEQHCSSDSNHLLAVPSSIPSRRRRSKCPLLARLGPALFVAVLPTYHQTGTRQIYDDWQDNRLGAVGLPGRYALMHVVRSGGS